MHVIEHVAEPDLFVSKALELLNTEGALVLATPNTDCVDFQIFGKQHWGGYHTPRHWYLFEKKSFDFLVERLDCNLIEFQVSESKFIVLNDVINFSAETIYFGPQNEYSIYLSELFLNGELENLGYINSIIDKLVSDNVAPKYKLAQLFNLTEHNSKKEVFDKLNYQFTKTNTKPNRAQLLFVLLYNQYSNL